MSTINVIELNTATTYPFTGLTPRKALIAAYAYTQKNGNTWDFEKCYGSLVKETPNGSSLYIETPKLFLSVATGLPILVDVSNLNKVNITEALNILSKDEKYFLACSINHYGQGSRPLACITNVDQFTLRFIYNTLKRVVQWDGQIKSDVDMAAAIWSKIRDRVLELSE